MCIRNDVWRPRSEKERRWEKKRRRSPEGHAGDEGEELVMVMRRCNDSSAVCFEFSFPLCLSLCLSLSLYLHFLSLSNLFASFDSLPSLCLRMAMISPRDRLRTFLRLIVHRDMAVTRATPRNLHCVWRCVRKGPARAYVA